MKIILGKSSGFCFGVKNAIDGAQKALANKKIVYCLGEIIHNEEVIKDLESKGLIIVNDIEEVKDSVMIRSHGAPKKIYNIAKSKNIKLLDYTCPFVLKIHELAEKYSKNNYFIFLLGVKSHPETIGSISFCGNNSCIIENFEDIENAINLFKLSGLENLLILSQTTFSNSLFEDIINELKSKLSSKVNLEIKNTICNTTSVRQNEAKEIAKNVDLMIVIGGKHSSNTKKLYEIAQKNCKNSLLVQTKDDLSYEYLQGFDKIGIIAGASTPNNVIEDIVNFCKN